MYTPYLQAIFFFRILGLWLLRLSLFVSSSSWFCQQIYCPGALVRLPSIHRSVHPSIVHYFRFLGNRCIDKKNKKKTKKKQKKTNKTKQNKKKNHHLAVEMPTVSLRKFTEQSGRKSHNKENQNTVCDKLTLVLLSYQTDESIWISTLHRSRSIFMDSSLSTISPDHLLLFS